MSFIQGETPTQNEPQNIPQTPIQTTETNEQRFDRHVTNVKISVLWFMFVVMVIGIPATWFHDKRLTIEIIVTLITGVVGWFLNQLKPKKKK